MFFTNSAGSAVSKDHAQVLLLFVQINPNLQHTAHLTDGSGCLVGSASRGRLLSAFVQHPAQQGPVGSWHRSPMKGICVRGFSVRFGASIARAEGNMKSILR